MALSTTSGSALLLLSRRIAIYGVDLNTGWSRLRAGLLEAVAGGRSRTKYNSKRYTRETSLTAWLGSRWWCVEWPWGPCSWYFRGSVRGWRVG